MGFTLLDGIVIVVYLIVVAIFGIKSAGAQKNTSDYFLGGRSMPWWAILFSVVATETSTLTFISIPAVSYVGSLVFLKLRSVLFLGALWLRSCFWLATFRGSSPPATNFWKPSLVAV